MVSPLERDVNVIKHQMRKLWNGWSATYKPIEVPGEPGNLCFGEDEEAFLRSQPENCIWRVFGDSRDEDFEGYYIEPSGLVGFEGSDAYCYLVTSNPWTDENTATWWDDFAYMAVEFVKHCENFEDCDSSCELCGGAEAVSGSFISAP